MKPNWRDLGERAAWTFVQSFAAAEFTFASASGLNISQVTDVSGAKRFLGGLVLGAGSSALSALKTTIKAARSQAADDPAEVESVLDALGLSTLDVPVQHVLADAANLAAPAPPAQ